MQPAVAEAVWVISVQDCHLVGLHWKCHLKLQEQRVLCAAKEKKNVFKDYTLGIKLKCCSLTFQRVLMKPCEEETMRSTESEYVITFRAECSQT